MYFWNTPGKGKIESLELFEKQWTGVALAIVNTTDAGEQNYREERKIEFKRNLIMHSFTGSFIILLTILTYFSWVNDDSLSLLPKLLLIFVSTAGCYISYILIRQEKHQSGILVQKFCKTGTYIDCNQVTSSRYSKLFGLFSWAELGLS